MFFLDVGEDQNIFCLDLLAISQNFTGVSIRVTLIRNVSKYEPLGTNEIQIASFGYRQGFFVSAR